MEVLPPLYATPFFPIPWTSVSDFPVNCLSGGRRYEQAVAGQRRYSPKRSQKNKKRPSKKRLETASWRRQDSVTYPGQVLGEGCDSLRRAPRGLGVLLGQPLVHGGVAGQAAQLILRLVDQRCVLLLPLLSRRPPSLGSRHSCTHTPPTPRRGNSGRAECVCTFGAQSPAMAIVRVRQKCTHRSFLIHPEIHHAFWHNSLDRHTYPPSLTETWAELPTAQPGVCRGHWHPLKEI